MSYVGMNNLNEPTHFMEEELACLCSSEDTCCTDTDDDSSQEREGEKSMAKGKKITETDFGWEYGARAIDVRGMTMDHVCETLILQHLRQWTIFFTFFLLSIFENK